MKIEAVDGVPTDFLEADIADLMHTPTEKPAPEALKWAWEKTQKSWKKQKKKML